jgi:hypothetical protein
VRIFLDECVNRYLARHIPGHTVRTARQMQWTSVRNGALLALVGKEFEIFLTLDRSIPFQHRVQDLPIAVVILRTRSNALSALLPLVPQFLEQAPTVQPGTVTFIGGV